MLAGHARLELVVGGVPPSASVINKLTKRVAWVQQAELYVKVK